MTSRSRSLLVSAIAVIALGATACSSMSDQATSVSLRPLPKNSPTTTAPPSTTTTLPDDNCDPTASIRPDGPLPPAGQMPPGSQMAKIQQRGHLIVGVDQGTLNWGYRNPGDGSIRGLDVDLLRAVATAIFGKNADLTKVIEFETVTTAERISAVKSGKVDMVASLLTATCDRWADVDFSTVYYNAEQEVLVPADSPVHVVTDLAGKRVCATRGSTSIAKIAQAVPKAKLYPVDTRTDCLVALQEGKVDAITSDNTILASFQAQDGAADNTRILGALEQEPYAIAMQKGHEDLVKFVNSVLEQMRNDQSLQGLYTYWLGANAPATPPTAHYR